MSEIVIDSFCGLSCADCELKEKMNCGGCHATNGNPFHVTAEQKCEVAECVKAKQKEGNGLTFCGECADFPCDILKRYSNDPEHGDTPAGKRICRCSELKAAKTAAARAKLPNHIAICGFNCNNCMFTQWCGGCRSDYNCCSFATLFPDKKCPNVACAEKRGEAGDQSGCFTCPDVKDCAIGFFDGKHDGHAAKTAALLIKAHGPEACSAYSKLVAAGLKEQLDNTATAEEAVALLEKFI